MELEKLPQGSSNFEQDLIEERSKLTGAAREDRKDGAGEGGGHKQKRKGV